MTNLVASVKAQYGKCTARRISSGNCKILLNDSEFFADKAIVDFDKKGSPLEQNQCRCDFMLFAKTYEGKNYVIPIEIKNGPAHNTHAVKQLQAGVCAMKEVINDFKSNFELFPFIVSRGMKKNLPDKLQEKANRICLLGQSQVVRHITCGSCLVEKIKSIIEFDSA